MHTSSVIIGPVVTEKAERLKQNKTYIIRVQPNATKIDVKNALHKYYDVEVNSIRVLWTLPKKRVVGQGTIMEKRHRSKRMMVTLTKKSATLDLTHFQAS